MMLCGVAAKMKVQMSLTDIPMGVQDTLKPPSQTRFAASQA
jgi:hypothetical protein